MRDVISYNWLKSMRAVREAKPGDMFISVSTFSFSYVDETLQDSFREDELKEDEIRLTYTFEYIEPGDTFMLVSSSFLEEGKQVDFPFCNCKWLITSKDTEYVRIREGKIPSYLLTKYEMGIKLLGE